MCNCASEVRLLHSRTTSPEHAAVADWFRFRTIHARVPREGVLAGHYRYPVLSPVCNMNGNNGKAAENLRKHGVDFADAIAALEDPNRLEEIDTRFEYSEERIKSSEWFAAMSYS
jgi:Ribonuclease toxin, BrnT, of type II toxin-antitoxin system